MWQLHTGSGYFFFLTRSRASRRRVSCSTSCSCATVGGSKHFFANWRGFASRWFLSRFSNRGNCGPLADFFLSPIQCPEIFFLRARLSVHKNLHTGNNTTHTAFSMKITTAITLIASSIFFGAAPIAAASKSKSGKTEAPSISPGPSYSPSKSPSSQPTAKPSASPSYSPSKSPSKWYVKYESNTCVQDCVGSSPCGGIAESWDEVFKDKKECCEKKLWWNNKCLST